MRRLLRGVVRWRAHAGWYLLAVVAMPAFTLPVSLATGTLPHAGGWLGMAGAYLVSLVVGGVFTNVWEEVAWAGLVRSRLTDRRGLLLGAVATGPLFALQHLPLLIAIGGGPVAMLVLGAFLAVTAIFFRYVIGVTLFGTGGSLLIVGILHASSDAAGQAFGGGWQQMVATVPLALAVVAYRAVRRRVADTRVKYTPAGQVEPAPVPA